jgi:hypothetical protein
MLTFWMLLGTCFAHPADGYTPNELDGAYATGGVANPTFWNHGEITFMLVYPDASTLSDSEKYIIAGSTGSSYGHPLRPWSDLIFGYITAYESRTGEVPQSFSPEFFSNEVSLTPLTEEQMARFRSPITDEYPTFNNATFTPGGMYVKKLNQEEMEYYASYSSHYDDIWFNNRVKYYGDDEYTAVKLTSPVFYVRIYGENEEIFTQLLFNYTVDSN